MVSNALDGIGIRRNADLTGYRVLFPRQFCQDRFVQQGVLQHDGFLQSKSICLALVGGRYAQ